MANLTSITQRSLVLVPSVLGILKIMTAALPEPSMARSCGRRMGNTRVVGGSPTNFGEYGFMVLMRNLAVGYDVWCGGALVGRQHVVTAAHCVKGHPYQTFDLWIRTHNQKDPSLTQGEHFKISKAESMANFTKRTYENDVAVLTLDRPVNFGPSVWPICLPDTTAVTVRVRGTGVRGSSRAIDAPGTKAIVLGWGYQSEQGNNSDVLKEAELNILSQVDCKKWFNEAGFKGPADAIGEYHLCAGFKAGGFDSCQGDSGGPLVREVDGSWTLVGIVSAGIGCGQPNQPGLYARVTKFAGWIRSHMRR